MPQLEHIEAIEKRLWKAADTLRANSNYASNEYFGSSAEFVGKCAVILVEKRRDGKL